MSNNISLDTDCPQSARFPKFFVTALEDIKPPYVVTGDHLMIDPDAMPCEGKLVMVGERLEPWRNQVGIAGVAVYICREM